MRFIGVPSERAQNTVNAPLHGKHNKRIGRHEWMTAPVAG
jgi:hypothetical protein